MKPTTQKPSGKVLRPLLAIRKKCLDCSGDSSKGVRYCPCCDCTLWFYRFGKRPGSMKDQRFVTPEEMPPPDAQLEDLPR